MQNAILPDGDGSDTASGGTAAEPDVASRIARASVGDRETGYAAEVRALMTAALEVMRTGGPNGKARVADIVAAAGLSNDAFYRHFPSKDALVTALLEDGADRLAARLARRMASSSTPEDAVRAWVTGILGEARDDIAPTTRSVLANGGGGGNGIALGRHFAAGPLAGLVERPLRDLGSNDPALDASLLAHAVLGRLSEHLWQRTAPSPAETESVIRFCLAAAEGGA